MAMYTMFKSLVMALLESWVLRAKSQHTTFSTEPQDQCYHLYWSAGHSGWTLNWNSGCAYSSQQNSDTLSHGQHDPRVVNREFSWPSHFQHVVSWFESPGLLYLRYFRSRNQPAAPQYQKFVEDYHGPSDPGIQPLLKLHWSCPQGWQWFHWIDICCFVI